jgi:hypothetical protein
MQPHRKALQPLGEILRPQQHQRCVVDVAGAATGIDVDDADPGAL